MRVVGRYEICRIIHDQWWHQGSQAPPPGKNCKKQAFVANFLNFVPSEMQFEYALTLNFLVPRIIFVSINRNVIS